MPPTTSPGPALPAAAMAAWDAYLAMAASKAAHFEALDAMRATDTPRLAQAAQRAERLAEHDACVRRFNDAVRALARDDPPAHRALVTAIAAHAESLLDDGQAGGAS